MAKKQKAVIKRSAFGDVEFATLKEAADSIPNGDPKVINRVLSGKQISAYGYQWRYK